MSRTSLVAVVLSVAVAHAQQPSTYLLHEEQRRQAIADQIGTQEHIRWLNGLPSRIYGGRPYSLESIYSGLAYSPGPPAPWKTDVFEPWPFVPGDIYGRQWDPPMRQPLGHVTTPTRPNGYTYQPVYEWPRILAPPKVVVPPLIEKPRIAPPIEEIPSPELREF